MDYQHKTIDGVDLEISVFSKNGVDEIHLVARPPAAGSFSEQIARIIQAHHQYLEANGIPPDALVFSRYFVSDYANQTDTLQLIHSLSGNRSHGGAVSIVQQPPLSANKALAWFYLIHDKNRGTLDAENTPDDGLLVNRGGYVHYWSTRRVSRNGVVHSAGQTENLFRDYHHQLAERGFSLKDDCLRTWLFVKDIDFNYQGVVDARREFFARLDMTADTHYIASTGIEGRHTGSKTNVMMDAYAVKGLAPDQIRFLQARNHLNPTHEYGVTFERGTSVDYGDRRHVIISGTASIDHQGNILHPNDVRKQAARAVENIRALLADADAAMSDVAQLIVYLRDIADTAPVSRFFAENHPSIPTVLVWAPVCRPGWLVEIECVAIKSVENDACPNF